MGEKYTEPVKIGSKIPLISCHRFRIDSSLAEREEPQFHAQEVIDSSDKYMPSFLPESMIEAPAPI